MSKIEITFDEIHRAIREYAAKEYGIKPGKTSIHYTIKNPTSSTRLVINHATIEILPKG